MDIHVTRSPKRKGSHKICYYNSKYTYELLCEQKRGHVSGVAVWVAEAWGKGTDRHGWSQSLLFEVFSVAHYLKFTQSDFTLMCPESVLFFWA